MNGEVRSGMRWKDNQSNCHSRISKTTTSCLIQGHAPHTFVYTHLFTMCRLVLSSVPPFSWYGYSPLLLSSSLPPLACTNGLLISPMPSRGDANELVCYESRPDSVSSFRPSRSVRPMGLPVLSMHVNNVVDNGDDGDEKCWQYYFNQRKSEPQDDSCITRQYCPIYGTEKVAQSRRLLYRTPQYEWR